MDTFNALEIRAATEILNNGSQNKEMPLNYCLRFPRNSDIPPAMVVYMGKKLETFGCIKTNKQGDELYYVLEDKGHDFFARQKKSVDIFLQEESQKKADGEEKERLSLQDLRKKPEINDLQASVLKGTDRRHHQTLMMVVIGVLGTALMAALIKTCIR